MFFKQVNLLTNLSRYSIINKRKLSNVRKQLIMGIETSCDDTGCAVLDLEGNIMGEALNSQHQIHLNNGGIIPPIAQTLHRQNIEKVVGNAMKSADATFDDILAIATTVKPGLPLSLLIGMKYGKHLCRTHRKPFIPIHHMEAHALTVRMQYRDLQFPFLVLLISGGHCLLAVAEDIDKYKLLGETKDDSPGEAFDKMARRAKLRNLPEYTEMNGGAAIEYAAGQARDCFQFDFTIPLLQHKDCNFSFSGMKNTFLRHLFQQEKICDTPPDGVIPTINNLCAGFQLNLTRHICHRVQRAMDYVKLKNLIPKDRQTLVVSGGVACNNYIFKALSIICNEMEYEILRPQKNLCMDNGVMIAWNGVEKWKLNKDVLQDFEHVDIEKSAPFGDSLIEDVQECNIKCKWIKLNELYAIRKKSEQVLCEN